MPPINWSSQREGQQKIQNTTPKQNTISPPRKVLSTRNTTQFTKYNTKTEWNMLHIKSFCQRETQHKIQNTTQKQNTICPP